MKNRHLFRTLTFAALLGVAASSLAAGSSGFVALPASKSNTLTQAFKLAYPYTSRIDNNTANQISWNVNGVGRLNPIGSDDTQLVANMQTPPPAYANVYLYDQYGTYITNIRVPNRTCVEVNAPTPSGISMIYNCLQ